jgi:endonuclease/exonuclease/phosphatase family metal-dependent hydrolase
MTEQHHRTHRPVRFAAFLLLLAIATPALAVEEDAPLTITTWNIEHLGTVGRGFGGGYGGFGRGATPANQAPLPERSDADLEKIAQLIKTELGSDIIALQEVGITGMRNGRSLSSPLDKIVQHLNQFGGRWAYFLPQVDVTPAKDDEHNTFLGYLWNQNRVRLLTIFEMSLPNLGMAGTDLFERTPLLGYFEAAGTYGAPGNDFAIVNVHLASGQAYDENHLIAMTLIQATLARDMAKYAVTESDIMIMGDFNDNPSQVRSDGSPMYSPAMDVHMRFKGYIDLASPDLETTRMNNNLDSLIDHILVNRSAQAHLLATSATLYRPDSRRKGSVNQLIAWRTTFSDHFPLSFQFKTGEDTDVDFFD